MKNIFTIFLFILTPFLVANACSKQGGNMVVVTSEQRLDALEQKVATYESLIQSHMDVHGFIDTEHCDAVLFTGLLASTSANLDIDMTAARDGTGQWWRRPNKDCYPDHSKSTISRDMFLGILAWAYLTKNLEALESIYDYGYTHVWKMGDGDLSRVLFTTNMQSLLARMIHKLGGTDHVLTRNIPIVLNDNLTGFEAHLSVLIVWLLGDVEGKISASHFNLLKTQAERQPRNAFFVYTYRTYVDGNQDVAMDILLDSSLFPVDRLPTSADRGALWLWQRDAEKDWKGDPPPVKTHHGGDFLFLANLILWEAGR